MHSLTFVRVNAEGHREYAYRAYRIVRTCSEFVLIGEWHQPLTFWHAMNLEGAMLIIDAALRAE